MSCQVVLSEYWDAVHNCLPAVAANCSLTNLTRGDESSCSKAGACAMTEGAERMCIQVKKMRLQVRAGARKCSVIDSPTLTPIDRCCVVEIGHQRTRTDSQSVRR